MQSTATPPRTMTSVFPLKYVLLAFASESAAATVHVNLMLTIVLSVAAVVVVVVYGARNLSRKPRQMLAGSAAEYHPMAQ
jgi:hypothetical protein